MDDAIMPAQYDLQYYTQYGQTAAALPLSFPQPVNPKMTLNTPIGVCADRNGHVWVCDTSNNRVLILNSALDTIALELLGPGLGAPNGENPLFIMPFHIVHHPSKQRVYLTDIGNSRVCVYEYSDSTVAQLVGCFRGGENGVEPLADPNGITVLKESDGSYSVMVADEFFHYPGELTNRIVRFSEDGVSLSQFQNIVQTNGETVPLKWPQGLSSDSEGRLYIANTGEYGVFRTDSSGNARDFAFADGTAGCVLHSFGNPQGLGQLNIIRGVAVFGARIFVPDHIVNTVTIYDLNGNSIGILSAVQDWWDVDAVKAHSIKGAIYGELADKMLVGAYGFDVSPTDPSVFYVTEPLLSRVEKLCITLDSPQFEKPAELLAELGAARCDAAELSVVSCVAPLAQPTPPALPEHEPLPFYLRWNPVQHWYQAASKIVTYGYNEIYERIAPPAPQQDVMQQPIFTIDAGNWSIKRYIHDNDPAEAQFRELHTLYMPGDLSIASYQPGKPLLGQLFPGTPLFLVANYTSGLVRMYQYSRWGGGLIPYGLPFGLPGTMTMTGPMGMAVSAEGDVYIADSMSNRVAHWRILQTGQVAWINQFGTLGSGNGEFMSPADVALDAHGRVFVADQNNNRIQVFDAKGNYLWQFGSAGYTDDMQADAEKFLLPVSICIEGDFLFVNDLVNRALKVFRIGENSVQFVTGERRFGNLVSEGRLWMPFYIRIVDGYLFVPDCTLNVVNVFRWITPQTQQLVQHVAA
jgi:DNA-binding beta-propeller fold protein YncE